MSLLTVSEIHGKNMYKLGLEHAISMFEIMGEEALLTLKENVAETAKEIEKLEGEL